MLEKQISIWKRQLLDYAEATFEVGPNSDTDMLSMMIKRNEEYASNYTKILATDGKRIRCLVKPVIPQLQGHLKEPDRSAKILT